METAKKRKRDQNEIFTPNKLIKVTEEANSGPDLTPLQISDIVKEVFKYLDGHYLSVALVQKSWLSLAQQFVVYFLAENFGIYAETPKNAWKKYQNLLRYNTLPEVRKSRSGSVTLHQSNNLLGVLYLRGVYESLPQSAPITCLANVVCKFNALQHIKKNGPIPILAKSRFLKEWFPPQPYPGYSSVYDSLQGLISRIVLTSKKVSTYSNPENNQYKRIKATFNAICQNGSVLELQLDCWHFLPGDQWTDFGAQYLWINDYESCSCIHLVEYDFETTHLNHICIERLSAGKNKHELYSFQHQLGTKCGQYRKFDALFRLIREYITTTDHIVSDKIPSVDKYTPEMNLRHLSHSIQMLYRKYKGILALYQIIEDKKKNSEAWPFFLEYHGDNEEEFWNQVKEFALQINFLNFTKDKCRFQVDREFTAFSHKLQAEFAIGNEGESLEGKQIIRYNHNICVKDKQSWQHFQFCIRPWDYKCILDKKELPEGFTNAFIPDHGQRLIPKQFTFISHDTFGDILIILLGLAKYVSNTYRQQRKINYCKYDGRDVRCLHDDLSEKEGHTHTESMSFTEKCYDLDVDAMAKDCVKVTVPGLREVSQDSESESEELSSIDSCPAEVVL